MDSFVSDHTKCSFVVLLCHDSFAFIMMRRSDLYLNFTALLIPFSLHSVANFTVFVDSGYKKGIETSFVKRGRPFSEEKKEKDLVRRELARVRATAMEGSFGTQKEHYDLKRVKARTKLTEILYIFFGIHTANVVQLATRIEQRARLSAA